ncbi:glycosyltransferase [Catenulispora subtropica]|uniref:Glycosyltransferase n=1 Tax=Catenulispora subtropica TaxID=450798 RepID=A0ABP5ELZ1_9ACTN
MATFGVLSTYPPAACGLATFSQSLRDHLIAGDPSCDVGVVQVLDGTQEDGRRLEVVAALDAEGVRTEAAAEALNRYDTVIVQHEYGIYGGRDGENVTDVLDAVRRPVIVVLHTVLTEPSEHQRDVLENIVERADRVVVLSRTAARRLTKVYRVPPENVEVIPHGARVASRPHKLAQALHHMKRPTILTWGLIGPGKGIEWAIDALAELRAVGVEPRYLVVGRTHPKVLERQGEAYRDSLKERAVQRGVEDLVEFDAAYEGDRRLHQIIDASDVVLLPYDSREQVTSGVLIEAVAARRPIVATEFPHAVELLGDGAGALVPHRDPVAMARALRHVLTVPGVAADMTAQGARVAPAFAWPAVAQRYRALAGDLAGAAARLAA